MAVFLGCTSTDKVGLWLYGSMSRNTRRLNRQLFWFKSVSEDGATAESHPTDWEKPGSGTATHGLQDIGSSPTTASSEFFFKKIKLIAFN